MAVLGLRLRAHLWCVLDWSHEFKERYRCPFAVRTFHPPITETSAVRDPVIRNQTGRHDGYEYGLLGWSLMRIDDRRKLVQVQ